jgi:TolA-binding protein
MAATDEYELEEIKREIVESRSLTIKTNNLVNALSADLKSIAKRQQNYERRIFFNSATAYVVTVAVMFFALKLAWDARVDAVRAETRDQRQKLGQLQDELKNVHEREEARARANSKVTAYYALVTQNKRREIVDQFEEVARLPLTRTERSVFEQAVERARNELSIMAYQNGLDYVRTGRWHEAETQLRESLRFKSDAAHSAQATYELGRALCELGQQREAIRLLSQISEASPDKEVMDDATFLLAECLIDIQAWNDAKTTLRSFIHRFPDSPYLNDARMALADISLKH